MTGGDRACVISNDGEFNSPACSSFIATASHLVNRTAIGARPSFAYRGCAKNINRRGISGKLRPSFAAYMNAAYCRI